MIGRGSVTFTNYGGTKRVNEVFILIDEEYGEAQVFWHFDEAKTYFEELDPSKWTVDNEDDSFFYHEDVENVYIFRREII